MSVSAFVWNMLRGHGRHYEMFRMAHMFRELLHPLLEVKAMIHPPAKSLKEQSRLVRLAEVLEGGEINSVAHSTT
jgi:hypothetical protein